MENSASDDFRNFATKAIHGGYSLDVCSDRPIVAPIFTSAVYDYDTVEKPAGDFFYTRIGNRTRCILEKEISLLENAEYGLCFSSGMAAIFSVFYRLNSGDHVICSNILYGGTMNMLKKFISQKDIEVSYVDLTDVNNIKSAFRSNTKMIYTEACCNPLLNVVDVQALAKEKRNCLLVIDNTFITPYFQKPLMFGADIVVHSMTKYLNGHADVCMGALATQQQHLYEQLKDIQTVLGLVPAPFDCYLVSRGLKTLHLRMREHMHNATQVANYLENHPCVLRVLYPGLVSHPHHEIAKRQFKGYGGVVSFYVKGGEQEVRQLLGSVKIIKCSGSLGHYGSLISFPRTVSHAYLSEEERLSLGITDNLVRLSVGLEDSEDIIKDLEQAFKKMDCKENTTE